jgi:hypothetical protein
MQRCLSARFGAAESDIQAFAHGYVVLPPLYNEWNCVLEVAHEALYECNGASVQDSAPPNLDLLRYLSTLAIIFGPVTDDMATNCWPSVTGSATPIPDHVEGIHVA